MKTKSRKKFLIPAFALLLGALVVGINNAPVGVNAATFINQTTKDDFGNGISTTKYDVVGNEGDKLSFVDKTGSYTFGGFDYRVGFLRTENALTVGEGQSIAMEWQMLSAATGYISIAKGSTAYGDCWGDMAMLNFGGNFLTTAGSAVPTNADGTQTNWIASNTYINGGYFRFVFNSDGSAETYAKLKDTDEYATLCTWAAGTFAKVGTGYVGFMGNGFTGEATIDNLKIGVADDKNLTNVSYTINENFDSETCALVSDTEFHTGNEKAVHNLPSKSLVADAPASGTAILTKDSYTKVENSNSVVEVSSSFTFTSLDTKEVGVVTGVASDALGANYASIGKDGEAYKLKLYVGGEVKAQETLTETSFADVTATIIVKITYANNAYAVSATCLGKTVSAATTYGEGKVGIAFKGDGTSYCKITSLDITTYRGVVETGRDLHPTFANGIDHNWVTQSTNSEAVEEEGHVYIDDDHVIRFNNSGDGSFFSTKYKYANFDLTFKARKQQLEEDDDGNITKASTWLGVSLGRESYFESFAPESGSNCMFYIQNDTCDTLPADTRGWLPESVQMSNPANKDIFMNVHLRAKDGLFQAWITRPDGTEGEPYITRTWDTAGYIAFCSTAGGNFWIKDVNLVNLDGGQENNHAPVAIDYSKEVTAGETLNDRVTATDADEGEVLTYELVSDSTKDKGTLKFNKDGTYSFVANANAKGDVTFTYKAFDTEDYSEVKTVTITVKEKPVVPDPTPSSTSESSQAPVTPSSSEDKKSSNGGCGGAIVGTSIATVVALGAIIGVAIKRKKDEK